MTYHHDGMQAQLTPGEEFFTMLLSSHRYYMSCNGQRMKPAEFSSTVMFNSLRDHDIPFTQWSHEIDLALRSGVFDVTQASARTRLAAAHHLETFPNTTPSASNMQWSSQ